MGITAELKEKLPVFLGGQAKARAEAVAETRAMLQRVESLALELEKTQASERDLISQLAKRNAELNAIMEQLGPVQSELNAGAAMLRSHLVLLPGNGDAKAWAETSMKDLIVAEINATNAAIAAVGIRQDRIPAVKMAPQTLTAQCLNANRRQSGM